MLAFLLSVALHATAFVLITQLNFSSGYEPPRITENSDPGPIYLDLEALNTLHILRSLPVVKPAGAGGQPGTSSQTVRVVLQASSAQHPKFTITLNPLKPDNNRQAINQKMSPPDMKIQLEQKLPDIVLAEEPAVARPNVDMSLHKPVAPKNAQNQSADAAPTVASSVPELSFKSANNVKRPQVDMSIHQPTAPTSAQRLSADAAPTVASSVPELSFKTANNVKRPQVDMNLHQPTAPTSAQGRSGDPASTVAPTVASNAPELSLRIAPAGQQPQLPASYFAGNSLHAPSGGSSSARQSGGAGTNSSADPSGGVVVISVDPGTFAQLAALAQGNRYGQLAIAPSKEGLGSPGGSPNGTPAGGSGGPGRGGDGSSGVGPGHSGGGAGGTEGPLRATLSAIGGSGTTGGVDSHNLLGSVRPTAVFPITSVTKLRRPPLVVSTGPMGGGGLEVYGALPCGKVYTIFLQMPGKSWVLEYCARQSADVKPGQSKPGVVEVETGLVPPTVDQQFDFHRLAVPEKDADKLIVLRGVIDKDGSISDVHVYQGVQPEMDANAALAFSNWKFRPALRDNLPVSVDVLVGIPARVPAKSNENSSGPQGN